MPSPDIHPELAELATNWESVSTRVQHERNAKNLAIDLLLYSDAIQITPDSSAAWKARSELLEGIAAFADNPEQAFTLASLIMCVMHEKWDGVLNHAAETSDRMSRADEAWLSTDPHVFARVESGLTIVYTSTSNVGLTLDIGTLLDKAKRSEQSVSANMGSDVTFYGWLDERPEPRQDILPDGIGINLSAFNGTEHGRTLCVDVADMFDYSKKPFYRYLVGKVALDTYIAIGDDTDLLKTALDYADIDI